MTPAQRQAAGCEGSARIVRRVLRFAVRNAANENPRRRKVRR